MSNTTLGGILSVTIFIVISHLVGAYLLRRFFHALPKYPYLPTALGMIFFSYLFTLLGMGEILNESLMIYILFACGGISVVLLRDTFHLDFFRDLFGKLTVRFGALIVISLFFLYVLQSFLASFVKPIVGYDALAYHAYLPWHAINIQHSLRPDALIPNAGLPLGAQGILAWVIPLSNYHGLGLLNLFYLLATLIIVWKSASCNGVGAAFKSSILVLCIFLLTGNIALTSPSSDISLTFFSTLYISIVITIRNIEITKSQLYMIVLLNGFIVFIKPFALLFTLPLMIFTLRRSKLSTLQKVVSGFAGLIPYFCWIVYVFIFTRNPFFPIFQGIFKGIGFGPEVMTNEQDVRRSFQQLGSYLASKSFDFSQIQIADLQILFSLGIALFSITQMTMVYWKEGRLHFVPFATNASYVALLLYIGPIWRYFLFLNTAQLLYVYVYTSTGPIGKNRGRNAPPKRKFSLGIALVVFLLVLTLNKVSVEYKESDLRVTPALTQTGLTVNETNFQEVIEYLSKQGPKRILLMGEGRAAAFYPNSVHVLPADRRNPFSDPSVINSAGVLSKLKSFDDDLLIIASDWGWAQNIDVKLLEDFLSKHKGSIVFTTSGWRVYDISNLE